MTGHVVLVGMSVSDVDARDQLCATATSLGASVAFVQMGDPSLSAELTRLADAGTPTVVLVGVDTGPISPGHSWLRRIAGHWWRERSGHLPQIFVATTAVRCVHALEEGVAEAVADVRELTGDEPGLTSAAWEDVSAHRHQVMVCRGPRCTAQGAVDNLRAMVLAMIEHGLGDSDVLLVHTGCQFPCNQAPVVNVQPDDVWYGRLDPAAAASIVEEHLVRDQPLASHRLDRHPLR